MAKRAAAGAMSVSVWSDEETRSPLRGVDDLAAVLRITSRQTVLLKYSLTRIFAVALTVFAVVSFVSYAAYAHQWSELSALRHLGKAAELNSYTK
jgi:hypothetical protein